MNNATVISQVENGNIFIAYINGTNDNLYDIYCNSTDICKIACESSYACSTLRLHCFGLCFVSCDQDNGVDCPLSGVYTEWITSSPTFIPSHVPIQPSTIPTENPSTNPSNDPRVEPTDTPSNNASGMPSAHVIPSSIEPTTRPSKTPSTNSHPTNDPSIYSNGETTRELTTTSTDEINKGTTTIETIENDTTDDGSIKSLLNQAIIVGVICIIVFFVCSGVLCCGLLLVIGQRSKEKKIEMETRKLEILAANPELFKSVSATRSPDLNKQLQNDQYLPTNGSLQLQPRSRKPNQQVPNAPDIDNADKGVDLLSNHDDEDFDIVYAYEANNDGPVATSDGDVVTGGGGNKFDIAQINDVVRVSNRTGGVGDEHDCPAESRIVVDETKYPNWTPKQVILWMKINLDNNDIDARVTRTFLCEFYQKEINGAILKQLKKNAQLIDQLKKEFSPKNQVSGIWLVVKSSIISIGDQDADFID